MKKGTCFILVLSLLLSVTVFAYSDGLFGSIVKEVKEKEPDPFPSYSVYSHLPYDKVDSDDKTITYTYNNVSMETFEAFGVYLEKLEYSVWDSDSVDTTYILELGKKTDTVSAVISAGTVTDAKSFVIKYDTKSSTLEMVYPADGKIQKFKLLNNMPYAVNAEKLYTNSVCDHFGNSYAYSISVDKGSISVPVNKNYTTFSGIIAYRGEAGYDDDRTSASLTIYGDGKKLYESSKIAVGTYPKGFSVDITDCTVMEIVWSSQGSSFMRYDWGYEATIYNGMLY